MPAEVKNIIFTHEEIFNAINSFEGPDIPLLGEGKILSVTSEPGETDHLCVSFLSYGRNIEHQFLIS